MTKTHELTATIRRWTDKDGKKHSATMIVGAVFQSSKGNQVMKLDAWPLSSDFSGWVALRPCAPALPADRQASPGMPSAPPEQPGENPDEDMPF